MTQFRTYMTSSSNSDRRSEPGECNGQRGLPGSLRDPGLRDWSPETPYGGGAMMSLLKQRLYNSGTEVGPLGGSY